MTEHPTLFNEEKPSLQEKKSGPLADRMRPMDFDEVLGQSHLTAKEASFRKLIENNELISVLLWGPPGTGKTTLAYLIAQRTRSDFIMLSAVQSGKKDIMEVVKTAEYNLKSSGKKTLLFVDEIHRFNKAQQDAFLPFVERGVIYLVGATTENPSFQVITPLLSRMRTFTLHPLKRADISSIIVRAINDKERGFGDRTIIIDESAQNTICDLSNGDARSALNMLEFIVLSDKNKTLHITLDSVKESVQKHYLYDRAGEEHYNLISALHKSLRDSQADASLYWMARMLEGGEDPLFIARRLIRFASEDIGLADPDALSVTVAAKEAVYFIGMPEGELALAEAIVYLAAAPKSNALYKAYSLVKDDIHRLPDAPVPLHLRNAPTNWMALQGYNKDYQYAHNDADAVVKQSHFPETLGEREYYKPVERGFEREIIKRINWYKQKLKEKT